jgi:hypothetical protein
MRSAAGVQARERQHPRSQDSANIRVNESRSGGPAISSLGPTQSADCRPSKLFRRRETSTDPRPASARNSILDGQHQSSSVPRIPQLRGTRLAPDEHLVRALMPRLCPAVAGVFYKDSRRAIDHVHAAFVILAILIAAAPATLCFDRILVHGVVTAGVAIAIAIIRQSIRAGEAGHLLTLIRPAALVAAVPAIYLILQLLPLRVVGLSQPIWDSAAAALGHPIGGSASLDTGATILALTQYISTVGIIFVAAAVAIDRRAAERTLMLLTVGTALIAAMVIAYDFGLLSFSNTIDLATSRADAVNSVVLGAVVSAAATIRIFEGHGTTGFNTMPTGSTSILLAACLVALAMCCTAITINSTSPSIFAAACGLATLLIVVLMRRFGLGPWERAAITSTPIAMALAAVVTYLPARSADLALAFVAQAPHLSVTERMLADATWVGTGAGTFAALLPIYRDIDDLAAGVAAPSTAAAFVVEMGRPALWVAVTMSTAIALLLLRGALRRGRDFLYPALGASCLIALTVRSFTDAGVFGTATTVTAAAIFGLALAQSQGRRLQ